MESLLIEIASKLNESGVCWGLGGSMMLKQYGIVKHPKDIDILVALFDVERVKDVFSTLGKGQRGDTKPPYHTEHFYQYYMGLLNNTSIKVEVMSGYRIEHEGGIYTHFFDSDHITSSFIMEGVKIPLSALEDWFVSYQLLPNREVRVSQIENYFLNHGIQHPELLQQSMYEPLPDFVKGRIDRLLKISGFLNKPELFI